MTPNWALGALAAFIVLSVFFRVVPEVDLWASALVYDREQIAAQGRHPWLLNLREMARWLMITVIVVCIGSALLKLMTPGRPMLVPGRATVFLLLSLIIGPFLIVNVGLKDGWGRPRPNEIVQHGGPSTFVPAWQLNDQCDRNCSFVSGEVSATTWLGGIAMVAPVALRLPLATAALVLVVAVSGMRMAFGGHFLSDVVLSALLTYLVMWVCHWGLYRLDPPALRSATIERALANAGFACRRTLRLRVRQTVGHAEVGSRQ